MLLFHEMTDFLPEVGMNLQCSHFCQKLFRKQKEENRDWDLLKVADGPVDDERLTVTQRLSDVLAHSVTVFGVQDLRRGCTVRRYSESTEGFSDSHTP